VNILIISQCDKRALTETRRILDQFAERRGDRTWQTPITQNGLDTLRRLLRKTARKNTAVSCHWIRGLDHSELLWIVGDASRFNAHGAVPTDTTTRSVLRRDDENDWHTGEDIHLLTALAALLHDLGKASDAFQQRLAGLLTERNQVRHEWVSLRLFEAFVGGDDDATWLKRLEDPSPTDDAEWIRRLRRDGIDDGLPTPFSALKHAPLAQAVGWLVVTHHRLPVLPPGTDGRPADFQAGQLHRVLEQVDAAWNDRPANGDRKSIEPYWSFRHGLPVTTDLWRKRAARIARGLVNRILSSSLQANSWLGNPYVMHLARLSLMLADHHYSGLEGADPGRYAVPAGYPLHANTAGPGRLNQTLDEHLLGVAQHGSEVTRALQNLEQNLPRLARHKGLRKRSQDERFRWQDKAAELAGSVRARSMRQGAFVVNMASTGCGKTLANARVMFMLADPERGMRCAFAMGLRTLTLQTGRAFRDLLNLGDEDLAIRVGGSASRELFEHYAQKAEASGSASAQSLVDEDSHVCFEGNVEGHPLLRRVVRDSAARALLLAPLLVCTIDHLTPATESQRGGRQIIPMLRLMTGDLVLDEPDDFDVSDLPALSRLVHWAGLLGSRVLLSSATLPPALVQGLFESYRHGRQLYERNRGDRPDAAGPVHPVCCLWIDEFRQVQLDCGDPSSFAEAHQEFAQRRAAKLVDSEVRRRATLQPLPLGGVPRDELPQRFAALARDAALALHRQHHTVDPSSGRRVSFGLIRMANIEPMVNAALAMYRLGAPSGVQIHLCTYHSQFPLLIRSAIERRLDAALDRRSPDAVFDLPDIRQRIRAHAEVDQIFIVLGSPVTEVGRDHDYDWAVVEPSSMRSLIQLAGRVRRHRPGVCSIPNIVVFDCNLRHFRRPGQPAYCSPGFETTTRRLHTHQMSELWPEVVQQCIDSRPRIVAAAALQPRTRLADLEHECMQQTMLPRIETVPARPGARQRSSTHAVPRPLLNAASWWNLPPADALLTGVLPRQQPFRHDPTDRVDLLLRPGDEGDNVELVMLLDAVGGRRRGKTELLIDRAQHHRIPDSAVRGPGIIPWGETDYLIALGELAYELDLSPIDCARRFGTVRVPAHEAGWRFHPSLGFTKYVQGSY